MKRVIYLLVILSALVFIGYICLNQKEFLRSQKTNNGSYTVEIYAYKRFFAAPGDGGMGSRSGFIKLLDKDGNEIGNTSNCPSFFLRDIELDLGIIDNTFFFTRSGGINLKTGKCE